MQVISPWGVTRERIGRHRSVSAIRVARTRCSAVAPASAPAPAPATVATFWRWLTDQGVDTRALEPAAFPGYGLGLKCLKCVLHSCALAWGLTFRLVTDAFTA